MNVGLKAARGCYIGIVEPDDWVEPGMFQCLVELAQQHGADIAKANYYMEKNGRSIPSTKLNKIEAGVSHKPEGIPSFMEGAPCIWSAVYRREWLQEHGIDFSEAPGASFQDIGFYVRTWLKAGVIAVTHEAYYHYRENNKGASSRKKEEGDWAAYKEIELLADTFQTIPPEAVIIRSILVKRIFATMRADYRVRIQNAVKSFLLKYSNLLNRYFPRETLEQNFFTKNEWYDLQLIYTTPLLFPRKSRTRANRSSGYSLSAEKPIPASCGF